MKPAPFEYVRASSAAEAVRTLVEAQGEGKILAGGQSLVPVLAMRRVSTPDRLGAVHRRVEALAPTGRRAAAGTLSAVALAATAHLMTSGVPS